MRMTVMTITDMSMKEMSMPVMRTATTIIKTTKL
jgi:hypothetical protein